MDLIGLWDLEVGSIKPKLDKIMRLKKDMMRAAQPGRLIKANKLASLLEVTKWMAPCMPLGQMFLEETPVENQGVLISETSWVECTDHSDKITPGAAQMMKTPNEHPPGSPIESSETNPCLLYTSDAADE